MMICPVEVWPDREWEFALKFIMRTRRRRGTVCAGADEREHLGGGFPQRRDAVWGSQPKSWYHEADILGKNGSPILF